MTDRPVNRCAVKGCPVLGYWRDGERCPMHRDDADQAARIAAILAWAEGRPADPQEDR